MLNQKIFILTCDKILNIFYIKSQYHSFYIFILFIIIHAFLGIFIFISFFLNL